MLILQRFFETVFLRGDGYQFWSGIGVSLFYPFTYWLHHVCHVPGCFRWGHPHPQTGNPVCKKHKEIR